MYPEYPFTSHYIKVNGHSLHYIDEGKGPAVMMIHGNPTWSYYYRNLIHQFCSSHRVIVPDHMGCGLSAKPEPYNYCLQQHIDNLEQLLVHTGIDAFSLVVHDWGGAIGFGLAARHVERVEKIVVLNTAAFRSTRIPLRIRLCRMPVLGEIIVRFFNGFAGSAVKMAAVKKVDSAIASAYISPYNSWKNRVAIYNFVKDIPLESHHRSYRVLVEIEKQLPLIRAAKIPIKIIWGGKDFCFDDMFYREWVNRFPEAQCHYFPDAGHYVLEDKKDEIAELLNEFFRG